MSLAHLLRCLLQRGSQPISISKFKMANSTAGGARAAKAGRNETDPTNNVHATSKEIRLMMDGREVMSLN